MKLYDQAEEKLTPLIWKYKLKNDQKNWRTAKKSNKLLGELYLLHGLLQYYKKQFDNASIYLNESLKYNPNNLQANIYMKNTYNSLGQYDKSPPLMMNLIKSLPENYDAYKGGDSETNALFDYSIGSC